MVEYATDFDNILVFNVLRAVARQVECRVASTVLRELMSPECYIRTALVDPVSGRSD